MAIEQFLITGGTLEAGESARRRLARLRAQEAELEHRLQTVRGQSRRWQAGEEGERRIAECLAELPAGWHVLHDRRKAPGLRANIDHIAIGPTGVHVIDAKNWAGVLETSDAGVRCGTWPRNRETATVAELRDLVSSELVASGWKAPVFGVIGLANEANTARTVVHAGIAFVPASRLASALTALDDTLSPEQVYRIWEYLDETHPLHSAPTPVSAFSDRAGNNAAGARPRRRKHSEQRRSSSGLASRGAQLVLVAVALLVGLAALPTIAQHIGTSVSKSIARSFATPSIQPTAHPATPPAGPTRACSVMPTTRVSKLLGRSVRAQAKNAGAVCEFRVPGAARPAAVVAAGPSVGIASWQHATWVAYGVYCGKYSLRSDGGVSGACVDTVGTGVTDARAFAFDNAWIAAANRH